MIVGLRFDDLVLLVDDLGVGPIRDVGLLQSAAARPGTVVFGHEAYVGVDRQAAALLESLVSFHPLVDGDKRLGWLATVVFYGLNDVAMDVDDDAAYDLVVAVAAGTVEIEEIARRLILLRS